MTFRLLWAVDDWGHRVLPRRLHRALLGLVCDWLDDQLLTVTDKGRRESAEES